MRHTKATTKGFALVEVLIACAIVTVATFALVSAGQKGVTLSERALKQTQASYLLEEGAEAVKVVRDNSWATISALSVNTPYYLSFDTGTNTWSLSETPSTIDGVFTRTVTFEAVTRDGNDDIAATGTVDARTRKVDIAVSWPASTGTLTKTLTLYVADIFN